MTIKWLDAERRDAKNMLEMNAAYVEVDPHRLLALLAIAKAAQDIRGDRYDGWTGPGCEATQKAVQAAERIP